MLPSDLASSDSLCMTLLWVTPPDPGTDQCSGSPLKRPERNARRWRLWFSSGLTSELVLDMPCSVSRPTLKPDRPQSSHYSIGVSCAGSAVNCGTHYGLTDKPTITPHWRQFHANRKHSGHRAWWKHNEPSPARLRYQPLAWL